MRFEHIILPTDGSDSSLRPLEQAAALFEGARVTLVQVLHRIPLHDEVGPYVLATLDGGLVPSPEEARESLRRVADGLPESAQVDEALLEGPDAGRAIAEWANDQEASLIAVSTHGRSGLRRLVLGSVAESILRHASVPVLAFPPGR